MSIKTIKPLEFKKEMSGEFILIDVRTPQEYESGSIDGSINIDINSEDFFDKVNKLDKSQKILVYCHSGGRSFFAAKLLENIGFKEIIDLDGGIESWNSM